MPFQVPRPSLDEVRELHEVTRGLVGCFHVLHSLFPELRGQGLEVIDFPLEGVEQLVLGHQCLVTLQGERGPGNGFYGLLQGFQLFPQALLVELEELFFGLPEGEGSEGTAHQLAHALGQVVGLVHDDDGVLQFLGELLEHDLADGRGQQMVVIGDDDVAFARHLHAEFVGAQGQFVLAEPEVDRVVAQLMMRPHHAIL